MVNFKMKAQRDRLSRLKGGGLADHFYRYMGLGGVRGSLRAEGRQEPSEDPKCSKIHEIPRMAIDQRRDAIL